MNKKLQFGRRKLLVLALSSLVAKPLLGLQGNNTLNIYVVKNAQCGCCDAWVKILEDEGFMVTTENRSTNFLTKFKIESGIPQNMRSCHTAIIDGYFVEGHVPASDIKRLIIERPSALGIAVPRMPYGSPGMGSEADRDSYDVFLIKRDGTLEIFQHYPKASLLV